MLHLNRDGETDLTLASKLEEIIWKVLILDVKSQAVLSLVLRVNDLLRCGITVHLLVNATRLPLPDVPAIYFVEPSAENIALIISDLQSDKYESFHINFTSSIDRELLEEFAKRVLLSGKGLKIKQVFDQYLDFVVTEPNLFSLGMPGIFSKLNNPSTTEDDILNVARGIADGLMATLITMDSVPIIRCPKNGAAELVATQLDAKLRDYLNSARGVVQPSQRPVLILLDRNIDLALMFSHSWIYQCMVSDVFELRRNTIILTKHGEKVETVKHDVDPRDFFWNKNAQLPFPDVVENADMELNAYKAEAQGVLSKTGANSLDDVDTSLTQTMEALPELTARKKTLDMHMDVLALLLKELEARGLDKFFEVEQNCANPKAQAEFLELLDGERRDTSSDQLRTFLILYLMTDLSQSFIDDVVAKLSPKVDMAAFSYVQKFKQIAKLSKTSGLAEPTSAPLGENNLALFTGLSLKLYGLAEGRISEGISSFASGLKKLLPEKKSLPLTNVVEAIMDPTHALALSTLLTDDYLYLDPRSRGGHSKPPKRQLYDESMVFVVGGGLYLEYQNLMEWLSQPGKGKAVVYGSTEVVTALEFMREITALGHAV